MDSSIVFGLIGGLVAVVIGTLITNLSRKKVTDSILKYGIFILILAFVCLAFSLFVAWASNIRKTRSLRSLAQ